LGRYTKYKGMDTDVVLSVDAENNALHTIGSKAFLSCKAVERLVLPPTVKVVEDWAFAHMKNLKEIVLPAGEISFGRQVFLGCDGLKRVLFYTVKNSLDYAETYILGELSGIGELWASMFRFFPQERLEHPELVTDKEGCKTWLELYDEALELWLQKPDDDGFVPAFIGWFDVEDVDDQKARFIVQQKKYKIRLVLQRLRFQQKLSENHKLQLEEYLKKEDMLTELMFLDREEACSRDIHLFRVWEQAGGLYPDRVGRLLEKVPEEEPEIRGYLLKLQLQKMADNNFFEDLDL